MDPNEAAEQRANAVAKLRRAASLPRMKNGRRPQMQGSNSVNQNEGDRADGSPPSGGASGTEADDRELGIKAKAAGAGEAELEGGEDSMGSSEGKVTPALTSSPTHPSENLHSHPSKPAAVGTGVTITSDPPTKRRSRSRSRSRGSKDLKAKFKAFESPNPLLNGLTPLNANAGNAYESADEYPQFSLRSAPVEGIPPLLSSNAPQFNPFALFPRIPPGHYPGVSPSPLPSLEAIQSRHLQQGGLYRSSSAAARMMAMRKLTGEPVDPQMLGITPTQAPAGMAGGKLTRNNTVAGGERLAARQLMLRRLGERLEKTDGEQTSGGEDLAASVKNRRRRSKRKSGSSTVVDDREPTATPTPSANTPTPAASIQQLPDNAGSRTPIPLLSSLTPIQTSEGTDTDYEQEIPQGSDQSQEDLNGFLSPRVHRGIVVEDEDDFLENQHGTPTQPRHNLGLPETLSHASAQVAALRTHVPSTPSMTPGSRTVFGYTLPAFDEDKDEQMERSSPFRQDAFSKNPFRTPLREKEERVVYPDPSQSSYKEIRDISWDGDLVGIAGENQEKEDRLSWIPQSDSDIEPSADIDSKHPLSWIPDTDSSMRMPVHDDDSDDDPEAINNADDLEVPDSSSTRNSILYRESSASVMVEIENPPDESPNLELDPTLATHKPIRESGASATSEISSRSREDPPRSSTALSNTGSDSRQGWSEDPVSKKKSSEGLSTWSRVKNTFTRSNSSAGRRSRTNSTSRKDNYDSNRESGASTYSNKRESKGEYNAGSPNQAQGTGFMQVPSASTSNMSLPPPRSGVSPIPPPSESVSAKYSQSNPKLFPFPGIVKTPTPADTLILGRTPISPSSPDISNTSSISSSIHPTASSASSTSAQSQAASSFRDRRLSHQASDSRLVGRTQPAVPQPPRSATPTSMAQRDREFAATPTGSSLTPKLPQLPHTMDGVRKWLSVFKSGSSQQISSPNTPDDQVVSMGGSKKPSLSDILSGRKDHDLISDVEDQDRPRASTNTSVSTIKSVAHKKAVKHESEAVSPPREEPVATNAYFINKVFEPSPRRPTNIIADNITPPDLSTTPLPSPADPVSTTPDPASSVDDSSARTSQTSGYSIASSAQSGLESMQQTQKAAHLLQRLDSILRSDDLNRMWASAITSPPRRLLLSTPVLQVVNSNTVKDRVLFLFTDMLVIMKPIFPDRNSLLDNTRPYPPDRKFVAKSVVHLRDIVLYTERTDDKKSVNTSTVTRSSYVRSFITEFAANPDTAILNNFDLRTPSSFQVIGRTLSQIPELDKGKLGEYLSHRSSKQVLKAFFGSIGFTGMNIETALRVFLLSIHIPSGPGYANAFDYLLESFADGWYEANAGIVAFDRDLAVRLVRFIVRLNDALHPARSDINGYHRQMMFSKDFIESFRRHDPRCQIPDAVLDRIYTSIRLEKLCQARNPRSGRTATQITLKRPVPTRLTYRRQSDPIVIRIPQADPNLTIHLHGQDLVFDPPVLTFSRSSETSFRVTGQTLGLKSIVMACFGTNAPNYSGLPLSSSLVVERAFMRNTFQLAFENHRGKKRNYMFSVDDPVISNEWMLSLKRQVDVIQSSIPPELPGPVQMQVYRAAEMVSFCVLRDTLLSENSPSPVNESTSSTSLYGMTPQNQHDQNRVKFSGGTSLHTRSQSRSQVYRLGADQIDRHLYSDIIPDIPGQPPFTNGPFPPGNRLWTSGEIESISQQNSSIALVLSFLQAALPYNGEEDLTFHSSISSALHRSTSSSTRI